MANADALDALLRSKSSWNEYSSHNAGTIDLTFADLSDTDLSGRAILRCDFSGANLDGANLDYATISSCKLTGTNLSSASLVHCDIADIIGGRVIAKGSIIRQSKLTNVNLIDCDLSSVTIEDAVFLKSSITKISASAISIVGSRFEQCSLEQLRVQSAKMERCTFLDCSLVDWEVGNFSLLLSSFERSRLWNLKVASGLLSSSSFANSRVDRLFLNTETTCKDLDFSNSTVARTDLRTIGLNSAILLDTAFLDCSWPEQTGRISVMGCYTPSPYLPMQAAQDLKGVPPLVRRDIADAQYIVQKVAASSLGGRLAMRLWGGCSGFGQSISRLTATTIGLVALATMELLAARGALFDSKTTQEDVLRAAIDSFEAFFSFAELPKTAEPLEMFVVVLTRIFGFLALGVWISISSIKLNKLGAE